MKKDLISLFTQLMPLAFCLSMMSVNTWAKTPSTPNHQHAMVYTHKKVNALVDINTADAKTLMSIKGIGKKKAASIIAYRKLHGRFKSLNDLIQVHGMGTKALERLLKDNSKRLVVLRHQ